MHQSNTTICTPSFYRLYPIPSTYLVSDAGTVKGYRVATIILVRRQDVRVVAVAVVVLSLSHRILRHSYGISLPHELAREHPILTSLPYPLIPRAVDF
jgi:hypothetical protein